MRTVALVGAVLFVLLGAALVIVGREMETEYQVFRAAVESGSETIPTTLPHFLSPAEQELLQERRMLLRLKDGDKLFRRLLPEYRARGKVRGLPLLEVRKRIRAHLESTVETSWRASAVRGEFLVRDLVIGLLLRDDPKGLEKLWKSAAEAYKNAPCAALDKAREYEECLEVIVKSYEFLIRPSNKGGLGDLERAAGGNLPEEQLEIPLIQGSGGAGPGAGAFGTR